MAVPPDPPDITELLFRASAQVSGALTLLLRPLGLQVDEMRVLAALRTRDGRPMGTLAEELVIGSSTLTKMVDRLVSENLVYRGPDPDDRRRVRLYLTTQGERIAVEAGRVADGLRSELAASLGPDAELDRTLQMLLDATD